MYALVIADEEGHTVVVPLMNDEITVGRNDDNTIQLTERNVFRSHARLLGRGSAYTVEDLGAYNGVRLNGERLVAGAVLCDGDQLGIGDDNLTSRAMPTPGSPVLSETIPPDEDAPALVNLDASEAGAKDSLHKSTLQIGLQPRLSEELGEVFGSTETEKEGGVVGLGRGANGRGCGFGVFRVFGDSTRWGCLCEPRGSGDKAGELGSFAEPLERGDRAEDDDNPREPLIHGGRP